MKEERYGHTKLQKKIIEYGLKGKLTIRKLYELFDASPSVALSRQSPEEKAIEEIKKLKFMGLVKIEEVVDEKGNLLDTTRLLWVPHKDDVLPLDPGDVVHDHIADALYEAAHQFLHCHLNKICQKCGKKIDYWVYVGLDCHEDMEEKGIWYSIPMRTIILCEACHAGMLKWLDIPTHDYILGEYGESEYYYFEKKDLKF